MYLQDVLKADIQRNNPVVYKRGVMYLFFPEKPKSRLFYDFAYAALKERLGVPENPNFSFELAQKFCIENKLQMITYEDKIFFLRKRAA